MERQGFLYRLDRLAATLAGIALLLMMLVGAIDVISSNLLHAPVAGTYEITETLMVASAFLAMAFAQARGAHIRVDLLTCRLPTRARAVTDLASQLLSAGLFVGIAWYGWDSAIHSIRVGEFSAGSLPLPLWPSRVALAAGASLMVVQSLHDLWRALKVLVAAQQSGKDAS